MTKDTKPDAWMPLYIGDWDGDTGHLDCEQDGAYGRIVRWYWRNGPLPDDDVMIARIIRMELKRWRKIRPALASYFIIAGGLWRHGRVEKELARWEEKRARAIERAAAGGRAKAAKSSATSTQQALLKRCTSASSTEVDDPTGQSTLCGQQDSNLDLREERKSKLPTVDGKVIDWAKVREQIMIEAAEMDAAKAKAASNG